ncbi:MAG: hypothetical protein GY752_07165 [bacterium]|nr:hypothetical protein [bacterium]MCP4800315.1 hypothetical protein [bacterium]
MLRETANQSIPGQSVITLALLFLLLSPAYGLDLFTLWQQPEIPLDMQVGARLDFRTMKVESGRRSHGAVRVQCVRHSSEGWVIEIIPMISENNSLVVPELVEAWQFVLDDDFSKREKELSSLVSSVVKLDGTIKSPVNDKEWKSNPLIKSAFTDGFVPGNVEEHQQASRIISEETLMCDQLVLTANTINSIELPNGTLEQSSNRVVTVSVHKDIPLLGIAYAVEKLEIKSKFISGKGSRKSPPTEVSIETMELVDYGLDAVSLFD